jgi:hypothetical protein
MHNTDMPESQQKNVPEPTDYLIEIERGRDSAERENRDYAIYSYALRTLAKRPRRVHDLKTLFILTQPGLYAIPTRL